MLASSPEHLLVTIGSVMGALAALAAASAKIGDMVTKRRGDPRRWERDDFAAVLAGLEKENARCHIEIMKRDTEIALLEKRLGERRRENHWLNNKLGAYMLQFGDIKLEPPGVEPPEGDENGPPR